MTRHKLRCPQLVIGACGNEFFVSSAARFVQARLILNHELPTFVAHRCAIAPITIDAFLASRPSRVARLPTGMRPETSPVAPARHITGRRHPLRLHTPEESWCVANCDGHVPARCAVRAWIVTGEEWLYRSIHLPEQNKDPGRIPRQIVDTCGAEEGRHEQRRVIPWIQSKAHAKWSSFWSP